MIINWQILHREVFRHTKQFPFPKTKKIYFLIQIESIINFFVKRYITYY